MATTNVPTPTVTPLGYQTVSFADVLAGFTADYQSVYGSDVNLAEDTQDGMWVSAQALAYKQACDAGAAVYAAFRPSQAQGTGLDTVVKVNGIAREVASYSTVDLVCVGTVGVAVALAVVSDGTYAWSLPAFTFPASGQVTVTATCTTPGAIQARPNTVTAISTPTQGWNSATNPAAASPGNPVETDAQLRVRQTQSTELPSLTLLDGIVGALLALPGVTSATPFENDTDALDANNQPGHTVAMLVVGGDPQVVAQTIFLKKGICGTFGTTVELVTDAYGVTRQVRFFRPTTVQCSATVTLTRNAGYTLSTESQIEAALAAYVSGLPTGTTAARWACAAPLAAVQGQGTFTVENVALARDGRPPGNADLTFLFYEQPSLAAANVSVVYSS